ncbi:amino acid adenylation domain-containing protein [Amycolatopsis speibonae]|uniref:Amino acid adenylation domain-containing protein n=1 Tax=Amycolatopsis speibonae TaxID=1450224 RepID=A0ABV7P0Q4_9PSEU
MTDDHSPQGAGYPHDWDPVLVGRFIMRHATRVPQATAIVAHGRGHTYAELAAAAESYGTVLRDAGLQHGDTVAVCMEPGFESVSVLLACSEAGYVFVPLNADQPVSRIADICHRIDARMFVVGPGSSLSAVDARELASRSAMAQEDTLTLHGPPMAGQRTGRLVLESDVAYVIFTSGSTGAPKGVTMSHRAAVVALRAITHGCDAYPRLASVAPLGFDFSILDTVAALGTGGTVFFVPRQVTMHPFRLLEYLRDHRIQQLHCVPTLMQVLLTHCGTRLAELTELRRIVTGGEEILVPVLDRLRKVLPGLEFTIMYGQTESICCTFGHVPNPIPATQRAIPLGSAYPGAELLLLDNHGARITEPGVTGELYLRAASLFNGYWQDPETTARALVPDPQRPHSGELLLRTGDLAVLGPDGLIFAGRRDHQVQIYGNRVELGEIERCITAIPLVREALVTAHQEGPAHRLIATVVTDDELRGDSTRIRDHCRTHLPAYMVPAQIQFVDNLSYLPSGKLDRNAGDAG